MLPSRNATAKFLFRDVGGLNRKAWVLKLQPGWVCDGGPSDGAEADGYTRQQLVRTAEYLTQDQGIVMMPLWYAIL